MPRGVVLLAGLLLLILGGIATAVAVPGRTTPPARAHDLHRWGRATRQAGDPAERLPDLSRHSRHLGGQRLVGPPLDVRHRVYVGGVVPNTPDNLVAWIMDPPSIDPLTAMPPSGVSEAEARTSRPICTPCAEAVIPRPAARRHPAARTVLHQ